MVGVSSTCTRHKSVGSAGFALFRLSTLSAMIFSPAMQQGAAHLIHARPCTQAHCIWSKPDLDLYPCLSTQSPGCSRTNIFYVQAHCAAYRALKALPGGKEAQVCLYCHCS